MDLSLGVWGELPALTLVFLFVVALVAGFIDTIAGGGGLLCVPALLWAGLSPAETLATSKLQSSFGTFSATMSFVRAGQIDPKPLLPTIAMVAIGAATGTTVVQFMDAGFMRSFLPVLLIGVALFFLFNPGIGDADSRQRMSLAAFSFSVAPLLGFYDGFFGPGTGSFLAVALVSLLGMNLRKATAATKLLNLTSNFTSLLFFLLGGKLVWAAGLTMAVGQFLGAQLGARVVISKGAGLVRPFLVVMSVLITIKLVLDNPEGWLYRMIVSIWEFLP